MISKHDKFCYSWDIVDWLNMYLHVSALNWYTVHKTDIVRIVRKISYIWDMEFCSVFMIPQMLSYWATPIDTNKMARKVIKNWAVCLLMIEEKGEKLIWHGKNVPNKLHRFSKWTVLCHPWNKLMLLNLSSIYFSFNTVYC